MLTPFRLSESIHTLGANKRDQIGKLLIQTLKYSKYTYHHKLHPTSYPLGLLFRLHDYKN